MSDKPRAIRNVYKSFTFQQPTGCNTAYIICLEKDNKPFKIMISMGKGGGCARGTSSAFSDLASKILKVGGTIEDIIDAMKEHDCHKRQCCSNQIALCLKEWSSMYGNTKVD
jgi:hypothetical protein